MVDPAIPKYLPVPGRKINPDFVALWEPYLTEGMAVKHVAQIFGVHKATVSKYYPGRGWNREQILEHSHAVKALNKV